VNGKLTISDIAKKVGVTPKTLVRWEKSGKIKRPKRDWKGWRVYLEDDLHEIMRFATSVYEPDELIIR